MGNYCTLVPYVKTKDGSLKESRLFKDLLSLNSNNRNITNQLYFKLRSASFIKGLQNSQLDDLGEPILSKVLDSREVKSLITDATIKDNILKSLGGDSSTSNTIENYIILSRKVNDFNLSSDYNNKYAAIIKNVDDNILISIEDRDNEVDTIVKKQSVNLSLHDKIKDILSNAGIGIETLNRIQENLKINGVVDYENASATTEGIISLIKLANNDRGVEALPEEFAHLSFDTLDNNDPIKKRLLSLLDNKTVLESIFGESLESYKSLYSDKDTLLREAAGKLIYQSWFNNSNPIPQYKTFVGRLIDRIKEVVKTLFNKDTFTTALFEANQLASNLGNRLLNNSNLENLDIRDLRKLSNLHQLANGAKKKKEILEQAIANTVKKETFYITSLEQQIAKENNPVNIIHLQDKLMNYQQLMNDRIATLNQYFSDNNFDIGIQNFITYSASELSSAITRLEDLITSSQSIQSRCSTLKNLKNIHDSLSSVINDIALSVSYADSDLKLDDNTKENLKSLVESITVFSNKLNNECQKSFAVFLSQFFDDNETVTYQVNGALKSYTKEDILDLLKTAEHDISIIDTWIESTANANDMILNLADKAMQQAKGKVKIQVEEIQQRLLAAAKALKDSGSDDAFMFEKHSDGSLSGRYVSAINWTAYFDDYNKVIATGNEFDIKEFKRTHWDYEENVPIGYNNYNFMSSWTDAQKEYYNTFMLIRSELINHLPTKTYAKDPMKAVQMNKSLVERLISNNPSRWGSQLYKAFRDSYTVKTDDTDFGVKNTIKDFNDEEIYTVPVFYVNNVEDNDLFRDTASSLIAFADMAINYKEMSEVSDLFEIGKVAMENREARVERNGNKLSETVAGVTRDVLSKSGNQFVNRYNEFLNTQLYNRYMKDENFGSVGSDGRQASAGKLAKLLNRVSSLNQLAVNFMAGLAAVGTDMIAVNSEVVGAAFDKDGTKFTAGDLLKADGIYSKNIIHVLGEMGNPIKNNKLNLFIDYFDILHEYENEVKNVGWAKSKPRKLFSENSLYFFMTAGSHFGETRTALAQAINKKIKSNDGTQEKSLWDVLQVVPIDSKHPERGSKLIIEDGFTLSDADRVAFSRSCNGLNQDLYGIYSKQDISKAETTAIGQLVFLYRRFIVTSFNRRYGKAQHNFNTGMDREGYYRSCWNFIKNVITDSQNLKDSIAMHWNDMTAIQRANIGKAINELGTFTALAILVGLISKTDWDDKDGPWAKKLTAYMSKRLKTETGAFSPVGAFGEIWNIIKSPAASIKTLEGIQDVWKAAQPWNWYGEEDIVKSGRYKGHSKGYKALMESPLVPMNKTIYKALHPEVGLSFYNQK